MSERVDDGIQKIAYWCGKPIAEMTREELIAIIHWQEERYQRETAMLQESRIDWMKDAFAAHRRLASGI